MTFLSKAQQALSRASSLHKSSYLTTNDHTSEDHQELRRDIEQSLQDYYSRTPLSDVSWCCDYVRKCLFETVVSPSFDPYKVRSAFQEIGLMVMNLYCCPWRQEFHRICLYGGRFKSKVGARLVGYKNLFLGLGYELVDGTELTIPEHRLPLNRDLLAALSFDCIMAEVICHDLIQVHLRLKEEFSMSLAEIEPGQARFSWAKTYLRDRYDKLLEKSVAAAINHLRNSLDSPRPNSRHLHKTQASLNNEIRHQPIYDRKIHDHGDVVNPCSSHDKNDDERLSVIEGSYDEDYEHENSDVRDLLQNFRLEDELCRQQRALERATRAYDQYKSRSTSSLLRSLAPNARSSSVVIEAPKSKSKFYVTERSCDPASGQIMHRFSRPSPSAMASTPSPSSARLDSSYRSDKNNQQLSHNYPQHSYL